MIDLLVVFAWLICVMGEGGGGDVLSHKPVKIMSTK